MRALPQGGPLSGRLPQPDRRPLLVLQKHSPLFVLLSKNTLAARRREVKQDSTHSVARRLPCSKRVSCSSGCFTCCRFVASSSIRAGKAYRRHLSPPLSLGSKANSSGRRHFCDLVCNHQV